VERHHGSTWAILALIVLAAALGSCLAFVGLQVGREVGGVVGFIGGAGLTIMLYLSGYNVGSDEERRFQEWKSQTQGPGMCGWKWGAVLTHGEFWDVQERINRLFGTEHYCKRDPGHAGHHVCGISCRAEAEQEHQPTDD
jgi:hypothetical protein